MYKLSFKSCKEQLACVVTSYAHVNFITIYKFFQFSRSSETHPNLVFLWH